MLGGGQGEGLQDTETMWEAVVPVERQLKLENGLRRPL